MDDPVLEPPVSTIIEVEIELACPEKGADGAGGKGQRCGGFRQRAIISELPQRDLKHLTDLVEGGNVDGDLAAFIFAYSGTAFVNGICQLLNGPIAAFSVFPDLTAHIAIDLFHSVVSLKYLFSPVMLEQMHYNTEKQEKISYKEIFEGKISLYEILTPCRIPFILIQ